MPSAGQQLYLLAAQGLTLVSAHVVYCLLDGSHLDLVLLAVFPLIPFAFVQLDRIYVPGAAVNDVEDVAGLDPLEYGSDGGVLVGERDGTGGQFGHPAGDHVGFEGVLLL